MTVLELLTQLSRISLLGIAVVTGIDYFKARNPVRRDIFLTFLSLTASTWMRLFTSVTGVEIPGQTLIGQCLVVAQPFLLVRLIGYFRPLPRQAFLSALAGLAILWVLLILIGTDRSPLVIVLAVGYFALVDGYAVVAFIQGALSSTGVVRQRLRFAAIGSLLLITALILAGLNAIWPEEGDFIQSLTQLCIIGCVFSYFLGFAPPRSLRAAWQHAELQNYLLQVEPTKDHSLEMVAEQLEEAVKDGIGNNVKRVRIIRSDPETGELLEWPAAELDGSQTGALTDIVGDAWQKRDTQIIRRVRRAWSWSAEPAPSDMTLIIPLDAPRPMGLLIVELWQESLFADEDLALLKLFGQHAAVILQNQQIIEKLAMRSETLEERVTARAAEIERSNQELKMLAYAASHDLQEPLRMISSYLQLIENRYSDKLDDEGHEFIMFAVDGATRMKALIQDVLMYSRVQTESHNFTAFNMQETIDEVCRLLASAINESQAIVTCDAMPIIVADRRLMFQLWQNLLSNAIKYRGDRKPEIQIRAERKEDGWLFLVKDNGIGIDPAYQDQIFVAFKRLHGRDRYAGTGIGLAICKKAVELQGGHIWVESTPGIGSTFYFMLPLGLHNDAATAAGA